MIKFQIRKAQVEDLSTLQDIARRTIDACYRSFLGDQGVEWFIESGESDREIERQLEHCDVLLDEYGPIAFTVYIEDLIHLLMVDVNHHRMGLGSQLIAHTEKQLFDRGYTTIRLETFEGNQQAINFYLKNGWIIAKKSQDKEHDFTRIFFIKTASQPQGWTHAT